MLFSFQLVINKLIEFGEVFISKLVNRDVMSCVQSDILEIILQRFDEDLSRTLSRESPSWKFLLKVLQSSAKGSPDEARSMQMLVVKQAS